MTTTEEARTPGHPFGAPAYDPASEIATQVMNLPWTRHGLGKPGEGFDDDGLCDRHGDVQTIADNVIKATPAPSSPDGLDNLRKLSEAASPDWRTNDATPYILGPPIDGEIDRFEVIARGPHGHAKSSDAIRKWQADRVFAVAAVNFVRTLISTYPVEQSAAPDSARMEPVGTGDDAGLQAQVSTDHIATFEGVARSLTNLYAPDGPPALRQGIFAALLRAHIAAHPAGQSAGQAADGWFPIETAPKDGTRIDLWVVPHDAFANGNADRLEARWMERVGWVRIGGGYVSECGEPTHWRPRPSAPGKPTPDSTRTGQVGTEEAVRSALGRFLFKRFETVEGFGEAHEELVRDLVALAARPAAPEAQGAWQDISTAPKDGTKLLLCVAGYEPCIGGWFEKRWLSFDPESFDHETLTKWLEDTTYEPTDWMPAPPSSGQEG